MIQEMENFASYIFRVKVLQKQIVRMLLIIVFGCCISCSDDVKSFSKAAFIKFYGDTGQDVLKVASQEDDGSYILLGSSINAGQQQMYLIKTNAYGIKTVEYYFGNAINVTGKALARTTDGGYVLIGDKINEDNSTDIHVVKTSSDFNVDWEKTVVISGSSEEASAIGCLPSGDFFILGSVDKDGTNGAVSFLLNSSGELLKSPSFIGLSSLTDKIGKTVLVREGGRLIWGGTRKGNATGDTDMSLIFTTENGISDLGDFNFGTPSNERVADLKKAPRGYILAGTSAGSGSGGSKIFIVKVNESNKVEWERLAGKDRSPKGSSSNESAEAVINTTDGGYLVVGNTDFSPFANQDGMNILLVKLSSLGEIEWEQVIGGKGKDEAFSVEQTTDGGYVIGATVELNGNANYCLIKTNSEGKLDDN